MPWLLLVRRTRVLGFGLGIGTHFAIAMLSRLALFSFSMVSTYVVYLERADVDELMTYAQNRLAADETTTGNSVQLMQTAGPVQHDSEAR